jgi:methionyl-tRNA synthetase
VLVNLAEWQRVTAILIKPFLPRTAETFYQAFNFGEQQPWDRASYSDVVAGLSGSQLRVTAPIVGGKPAPLFPKVEVR